MNEIDLFFFIYTCSVAAWIKNNKTNNRHKSVETRDRKLEIERERESGKCVSYLLRGAANATQAYHNGGSCLLFVSNKRRRREWPLYDMSKWSGWSRDTQFNRNKPYGFHFRTGLPYFPLIIFLFQVHSCILDGIGGKKQNTKNKRIEIKTTTTMHKQRKTETIVDDSKTITKRREKRQKKWNKSNA